jgi:hypothetical protein
VVLSRHIEGPRDAKEKSQDSLSPCRNLNQGAPEYRLGGVVVSVLATGPKGYGFKTRTRRWIFKGDKNPQHTFLSDGK